MYLKAFLANNVPTIQAEDLYHVPDALLIDVRTPEEYVGELGHIEETRLVTLGDDLEKFLQETKKDQTNIYNMQAGMLKWNEKSHSR